MKKKILGAVEQWKISVHKKVVSFYIKDPVNRAFYINRGFSKWFGWQDMQYRKNDSSVETKLEVKTYEDRFFDMWIQGFSGAYRSLYLSADIKPEYEDIEGNRKWASENRENLLLFFDGMEFIGSSFLQNGFISAMFVCPRHQRKGYAKQMLHYLILRSQNQGNHLIRLAVLDINEAAINLYKGVGFETERAFELSRLSIISE